MARNSEEYHGVIAYGAFVFPLLLFLLASFFLPITRNFWLPRKRALHVLLYVSLPWVILDVLSVARGWWGYNEAYIFGYYILNLPFEELLFFIVVPFSCLLLWWGFTEKKWFSGMYSQKTQTYLLVFCLVVGLTVFGLGVVEERTVFDVFLYGTFLILMYRSTYWKMRRFWAWNGVLLLLFLIFNTFLTALPIVEYQTVFMSGVRVGTIPVEDFLYNFSFLWLALLVYGKDHNALG